MQYQFLYKEKLIQMTEGCTSETQSKFTQGITGIYIAVNPDDPMNNQVLENQSDLIKFNINRNDTLNKYCQ